MPASATLVALSGTGHVAFHSHGSPSLYSCLVLIENCTVMSLIACLSDDVPSANVGCPCPAPCMACPILSSVCVHRAPHSTQHATRSHTSRPHALAARCLINIPESCLFEISSCLSHFSSSSCCCYCCCYFVCVACGEEISQTLFDNFHVERT